MVVENIKKKMKIEELFVSMLGSNQRLKYYLQIGDMSVSRILSVLKTERFDLFKTINTEKGIAWMGRQIKNFEGRFL